MRVHVGIPTHDGKVHRECLVGLLSAWSRIPLVVNVVQGSFLPRLRDRIVRDFLKDPHGTHLLCVDSDMEWNVKHLALLLELDVDFAFGLYVLKHASRPLACSRRLSTELRKVDGGEAFVDRYDRCGAGFVLLRRAALERMVEAYADEAYELEGERFVGLWQTSGRSELDGKVVAEGEDYAFCRRWRALGGEIACRRDVALGHVAQEVLRPRLA